VKGLYKPRPAESVRVGRIKRNEILFCFVYNNAVGGTEACFPCKSGKEAGPGARAENMKRILSLFLMLLLVLSIICPAAAETPMRQVFDSACDLLFSTGNVTVQGRAEFSLDGEWFKTAEGTYIQDGINSSWKWDLLSPRKDGSTREGGYTVIANGEKVFVMEKYYPGIYKVGSTGESDTILRKSVQLSALTELLRGLADQSETLLGADAVSVSEESGGGTAVRLKLDGDVPEMLNSALNLAFQFFGRRYFGMDYDQISDQDMLPMESFITVTQGLLASTGRISIRQADVTIRQDAAGLLESMSGSVSFAMNTKASGARTLDITFGLEVSGRGSSKVPAFDPEAYGVFLPEGAYDFEPDESAEPHLPPHDPREMPEDIESWQKELWTRAGYDPDEIMQSGSWNCLFAKDGTLIQLQDERAPWLNMQVDGTAIDYNEEARPVDRDLEEKLLSFLAFANPGMERGRSLRLAWTCSYGDETFSQIEAWPADENEEEVIVFVVREAPAFLLQYFACVSNG